MGVDLNWLVGASLQSIDTDQYNWFFAFVGGGCIRAGTLWRVVSGSQDHGHQFGLPAPTNSADRAMDVLRGARVTSIGEGSGDLVLRFGTGIRLEILTSSFGYESWLAISEHGDEVVGLGGGKVAAVKPAG